MQSYSNLKGIEVDWVKTTEKKGEGQAIYSFLVPRDLQPRCTDSRSTLLRSMRLKL